MGAPHFGVIMVSDPGRCWRLIQRPDGPPGQPAACPATVRWIGWARHRDDDPWFRVWSCDGHVDGVHDPRSVDVVTRGRR
jgi:hypothetical protein